jgi:hypothetical protein
MLQRAADLDGFFGYTNKAKENGYEIWYMEHKESI